MRQKQFTVTKDLTAEKMGSGGLAVLATPAVVQMVENTCFEYLQEKLDRTKTTVGVNFELVHLKPSKIGATITVEVDIELSQSGKTLFLFQCYEGNVVIAKGKHQRVEVKTADFLNQL